jgi:glutathione S-transferase
MKLYYMARTRATRPRWLLEEIGVDYDLEILDDERRDDWLPDYRAHVHPLGRVPAFADDGRVMIESSAICLHPADRFPGARPITNGRSSS